MTPRRLRLTSATLLAANLVPLCGVLWWQWSVSSVIVLYWFENIVIGVINVLLKMIVDLKMHLKEHRTGPVESGGSGG